MLKIASLALALVSASAQASSVKPFDRCEARLRLCFAKCTEPWRGNEPAVCNNFCTTYWCDAIPGAWKTLTEFLAWRKTHERISA